MKKTVYTLIVNDYAPNLTKLTVPLMERYARKIHADFFIIKDRKFPDMPPVYEKFQVKELSEKHKNDWSIFFDADALIHPEFWDVTSIVGKDVTVSNGTDFVPIRFEPDKYHFRDGRMIGKGNWCLMASDWCTDIWTPIDDLTLDEIKKRIHVTIAEGNTVIKPEHLIDDFVISRNIARYGLKHVLIPQLTQARGIPPRVHLYHQYLFTIEQKEFLIKKKLMEWAIDGIASEVNNRGLQAFQIIQQMTWEKDGQKNWEDVMTIMPCGQDIAKTIRSWGIEINTKNLQDVSIEMRRELMLAPILALQNTPERHATIMGINQWDGKTKWDDLLSVLPLGQQIAEYINSMGGEIKLKPINQLIGAAK